MAVNYVCNECNSENVFVQVSAAFDIVTQEWQLRSTYDQAYCVDCDNDIDIKEVELP